MNSRFWAMPPTTTTINVQRNNSNWPWLCSYDPGIREKVTNGLNNFARFPFELCGVCIFFICAIPDFISFVFGFFRYVLLIYIFCCHSWLLNWLVITKCPKTNEKKRMVGLTNGRGRRQWLVMSFFFLVLAHVLAKLFCETHLWRHPENRIDKNLQQMNVLGVYEQRADRNGKKNYVCYSWCDILIYIALLFYVISVC